MTAPQGPDYADPTAATTRAISTAISPGAPDPSLATIRAVEQAASGHARLVEVQLQVLAERITAVESTGIAHREGFFDVLTQRLNDLDRATVILSDNVNRTPTLLQSAIQSLTEKEVGQFAAIRELTATQFAAVDQRFVDLKDRTTEDKRVAQEALVAALAAAKELVGKQNEFSAAAIGKSEANTTTTIEQNRQLADANFAGLARQVLDLKDALALWRQDMMGSIAMLRTELAQLQTARVTTHDAKTDNRANQNLGLIAISTLVAIVLMGLALYGLLKP